jgi:hypothetical protein
VSPPEWSVAHSQAQEFAMISGHKSVSDTVTIIDQISSQIIPDIFLISRDALMRVEIAQRAIFIMVVQVNIPN